MEKWVEKKINKEIPPPGNKNFVRIYYGIQKALV